MASTSTSTSDTNIGRLRCSFHDTSDNASSTDPTPPLWFRPYQGKRSSFMLDVNNAASEESTTSTAPTYHTIPESPCNCYVDFVVNEGESPDNNFFFLGGFQMISSARSVEVFVTKKGSHREESLMKCRGIPVRDNTSTHSSVSDCFKVFCVIPGGPRPVDQLRLRLLSDASADSSLPTKLVSIQLTGRIPDRQPKQQPQPQQVQTPNAQITPSSSQQMMQQMMMMMASGGTPQSNNNNNNNNNMFAASATPVASGSGTRNPFFSPLSNSSETPSGRPPPSGGTPYSINTVQSTPTSHSSSLNNNNNNGRSGGGTPTMGAGGSPSSSNNNTISSEAIIAGVSFLVRSEGQAIVQLVQSEIQKSETVVDRKLQAMEQRMQQQQQMLETMIQQQNVMMSQIKQYHHNQQQQLQWMAMVMSQPQPQHQEVHTVANDVDTESSRLASERYPESPSANQTWSSFPMESSYDPTCRVHLPGREHTSLNINTNTDIPILEKKQETSTKKYSDMPPVDHSHKSPVLSGLSDAGGSSKGIEEHNLPKRPQKPSHESSGDEGDDEYEREDDDENEEKVSAGDDEDNVTDLQTKEDDDDDSGDDDDASGLEDGSSDQSGRSERDRGGGGDIPSSKDNNADTGGEEKKSDNNQESDAVVGGYSPEERTKEHHHDTGNYDADDDISDDGAASPSIMQKQLVFEAPPYTFPSKTISPISESNNGGSAGIGVDRYVDADETEFPSIEKKGSMVDHLSIRYCSTEATEMPSITSRDTMINTNSNIEQEDSIEILAVFPESPYGQDNGGELTQISSFQTGVSSPSMDGGGDIDDQNPSDSSDGGYDSQDVDDLVSVSLVENVENKKPPPPVSILKNGFAKGPGPGRPKPQSSRILEQNVFH